VASEGVAATETPDVINMLRKSKSAESRGKAVISDEFIVDFSIMTPYKNRPGKQAVSSPFFILLKAVEKRNVLFIGPKERGRNNFPK
jgi:hypothetical protein